jgi:hypothetical protein
MGAEENGDECRKQEGDLGIVTARNIHRNRNGFVPDVRGGSKQDRE